MPRPGVGSQEDAIRGAAVPHAGAPGAAGVVCARGDSHAWGVRKYRLAIHENFSTSGSFHAWPRACTGCGRESGVASAPTRAASRRVDMTQPHELRCYDYVNRPSTVVRDAIRADLGRIFARATTTATRRAHAVAADLKVGIGPVEIGTDVDIEIVAIDGSSADRVSTHEGRDADRAPGAPYAAARRARQRARLADRPPRRRRLGSSLRDGPDTARRLHVYAARAGDGGACRTHRSRIT